MNIYDIYNVINFDFIKIKILKKQVLDCIINLFCFYIYCVNEEQNVEQMLEADRITETRYKVVYGIIINYDT